MPSRSSCPTLTPRPSSEVRDEVESNDGHHQSRLVPLLTLPAITRPTQCREVHTHAREAVVAKGVHVILDLIEAIRIVWALIEQWVI